MKVVIPAKSWSTRVPDKNWKPFWGTDSLADVKVKQLLEAFDPKDVYLSCEDESKSEFAEKYGIQFLLRDERLTLTEVPWSDVVIGILDQLNIPDEEEVFWAQVTSPLFSEFAEIIDVWNDVKDEYDSMITTKDLRHYIVDENNMPVNYRYGRWHSPSQDLPKWKTMELAVHILSGETMRLCNYHVGLKPFSYSIEGPSVDIDTEEDFRLAQVLYEMKYA